MSLVQGTVSQLSSKFRAYIYWQDVSSSQEWKILNNGTLVRIMSLIDTTSASQNWNGTCSSLSMNINGSVKNDYGSFNSNTVSGWTYPVAGTSPTLRIAENIMEQLSPVYYEVFVPHNSDGTKTCWVACSYSLSSGGFGPGNVNISGSIVLPSIPRESTATATNTDIESATSININRYLSTYTTTLRYEFPSGEVGALTGTIATKTPNTSVGWTIPSSFYAKIPNAINGICKIYCDTYNGDTLIGTTSTTFTATAGVANKPDVSATIIDDVATALTGDNEKFVRFISSAVFNITSTPKNSATIVSRSIVCGAKSSTSASGTLTEVESAIFVVTTTDSRGLSNSVTYTKNLVDYVKLTLNPNITRTSPTGNTFSYEINGNYFNTTFGSVANTLKVEYRVSENGGTSYSSWTEITSITPSGNAYSKTGTLTGPFDYTKQAIFQIRAIDKIYTVSNPVLRELIIARGIPVYNWGDDFFRHNTELYLGSQKLKAVGETHLALVDINHFGVRTNTALTTSFPQLIPITKLSGGLTISSDIITLEKGYIYELVLNLYCVGGGYAYFKTYDTSNNDLMPRGNTVNTVTHTSGDTTTDGKTTIDMTTDGSNKNIKVVSVYKEGSPTISTTTGSLIIKKYKKIVV